jgi:CRISPR/Cas system CSM-associated protein Csm3 (group 7 of RAMP superfamily)
MQLHRIPTGQLKGCLRSKAELTWRTALRWTTSHDLILLVVFTY